MNKLLLIVLPLLVFQLFIPDYNCHLHAEVIDRIAAVVNNEVITLSDVNQEGAKIFAQIEKTVLPTKRRQQMDEARKEILAKLIENMLIRQRAEKLGVGVSDLEVDAAIDNMVAERNKTREDYKRELAQAGLTEEEHRKTLKNQILQSKLISYEVRSKIVIPEQKLHDYYEKRYLTAEAPDGLHILQMGFTWGGKSESATEDDAKRRAEQIRKMVLEGQNFKELALSFSELPSAADGGDLGIVKRKNLASYMREAIENITPGEVSPVIKTPAGYQFFMLLSAKNGTDIKLAPFEMLEDEIHDILFKEEMNSRYENWVRTLREEAFIKELL